MKCRTLKTLKADGNKVLKPGDIVDVPQELAIRYIERGKLQPIENSLFEQRFNQLADQLQSYTLTDDEIKLHMPGLHKDIQAAIERMDTAWLRFDYEGFLVACKQIEHFYFNALRGISEW